MDELTPLLGLTIGHKYVLPQRASKPQGGMPKSMWVRLLDIRLNESKVVWNDKTKMHTISAVDVEYVIVEVLLPKNSKRILYPGMPLGVSVLRPIKVTYTLDHKTRGGIYPMNLTQLNLRSLKASTLHKLQGMSRKFINFKYSAKAPREFAYCALSRCVCRAGCTLAEPLPLDPSLYATNVHKWADTCRLTVLFLDTKIQCMQAEGSPIEDVEKVTHDYVKAVTDYDNAKKASMCALNAAQSMDSQRAEKQSDQSRQNSHVKTGSTLKSSAKSSAAKKDREKRMAAVKQKKDQEKATRLTMVAAKQKTALEKRSRLEMAAAKQKTALEKRSRLEVAAAKQACFQQKRQKIADETLDNRSMRSTRLKRRLDQRDVDEEKSVNLAVVADATHGDTKSGLKNLGRTCYLNCALQLLRRMLVGSTLCKHFPIQTNNPLIQLFGAMGQDPSNPQTAQNIKKYLLLMIGLDDFNERFPLGVNHDSQEAFVWVLNEFVVGDYVIKASDYQPGYHPLVDIGINLVTTTQCDLCGERGPPKVTYDNMIFLEVPDQKECSLDSLMTKYVDTSIKLRCPAHCRAGDQPSQLHSVFLEPPQFLVVLLKRFELERVEGSQTRKIWTKVDAPAEMNIHQLITHPGTYELIGRTLHIGDGLLYGHFIADIKDSEVSGWTRFDDSHPPVHFPRLPSPEEVEGSNFMLVYRFVPDDDVPIPSDVSIRLSSREQVAFDDAIQESLED